ncbi:hypothetical protein PG990_009429 [Apiospora arundinis]
MASPASGGTGTVATKRSAVDDLSHDNTKRSNTRKTENEKGIIPVAALLHVDFGGLPKLCHRHIRQVNNLGNPFDAVERWVRRALPREYWTSNIQVGHWMRSKLMGVAYMFRNGYCYDNGREFVTVPIHGRWIEYDRFKCFRSDDGVTEWYSVLPVRWLPWPTENPYHAHLAVGSWTMARRGKPVLLGRDNRFYQSVLDAFRERNPAVINQDNEIDVSQKQLPAISAQEEEAPRPHVEDMIAYGDYLRITGGIRNAKQRKPTGSKAGSVEEKGNTDHSTTSSGPRSPKMMATSGDDAPMGHQDLVTAGPDRTPDPNKNNDMGLFTPGKSQILTPAPQDSFAVTANDTNKTTSVFRPEAKISQGPKVEKPGPILKGSPTIAKDRSDTGASSGTQAPSQAVKPQNHVRTSVDRHEDYQAKTNVVISKRTQSRTTQRSKVIRKPQPSLKPDIKNSDKAKDLQTGELHGKSEDLSFGIELEFMIPVILEEERDGTDIDEILLPAMNVIPLRPGEDPNGAGRNMYDSTAERRADSFIREWVENMFRTTLMGLGVAVMDFKGYVLNANPDAKNVSADRTYWGWDIGDDPSVRLPIHLAAAYEGGRTRWVSLELRSPAYFATPGNLKEIRRVLGGLSRSSTLRFITPDTTGFHIHVGRGRSAFNLAELKRLAGLCYAAGPLLSQLHSPSRHANQFCPIHRFAPAECHTEKAPSEPPRLSPETDESSQRPADTPLFRRMLKRGDLPRDTFQVETFQEYRQALVYALDRTDLGRSTSHLPPTDTEPRGMVAAINEMWRAPTSLDLAEMFQGRMDRNYAYNFMRYAGDEILSIRESEAETDRDTGVDKDGESDEFDGFDEYDELDTNLNIGDDINDSNQDDLDDPSGNGDALTVEFRQAASTLDADSVVAWVRVVVNLACAALHSRLDEYSRLVHACAKAEREPAWYDAFDLLVDLDMPRTAQMIQTRMLSRPRRSPWADLPADGSAFGFVPPEVEKDDWTYANQYQGY